VTSSKAETVAEYLAELPEERRKDIAQARALVRRYLPKGFKECMQYGMISWVVPLSRYPVTYNKQPLAVASLAAQKNYSSLYLHGVYASDAERKRFEGAYKRSGKKLDMGKSCVRFTAFSELATDVIADTLARVTPEVFIAAYEASRKH
jgi:hypothetical protein